MKPDSFRTPLRTVEMITTSASDPWQESTWGRDGNCAGRCALVVSAHSISHGLLQKPTDTRQPGMRQPKDIYPGSCSHHETPGANQAPFSPHRHDQDRLEVPVPLEGLFEAFFLHVVEGDYPNVSLCAVSPQGSPGLFHNRGNLPRVGVTLRKFHIWTQTSFLVGAFCHEYRNRES